MRCEKISRTVYVDTSTSVLLRDHAINNYRYDKDRNEVSILKEILKNWGKELWIAQEQEYGGKILIIKENRHTSQHYHKDKKETIYCFKGEVDIILNDKIVTLKEGDDITLPPKTVHRIIGKKNSILFEVSTPQLADVVRL